MKRIVMVVLAVLQYGISAAQQYPGQLTDKYWFSGSLSLGMQGRNEVANNAAWLEIGKDTTNKGMFMPRGNIATLQNPDNKRGLFMYNQSDSVLYHMDGTKAVRYMTYKDTVLIKSMANSDSAVKVNGNSLGLAMKFGTKDAQPLSVITANIERIRVKENGEVVINADDSYYGSGFRVGSPVSLFGNASTNQTFLYLYSSANTVASGIVGLDTVIRYFAGLRNNTSAPAGKVWEFLMATAAETYGLPASLRLPVQTSRVGINMIGTQMPLTPLHVIGTTRTDTLQITSTPSGNDNDSLLVKQGNTVRRIAPLSAIKQQIIDSINGAVVGYVYQDNFRTSSAATANYATAGSATASWSTGGVLLIGGTANDFTATYSRNWYSAAEKYTVNAKFIPVTTGDIAVGFSGIYACFTSYGKLRLRSINAGYTDSTATNLSYSNGDSIEVEITRYKEIITYRVRNLRTGSAWITDSTQILLTLSQPRYQDGYQPTIVTQGGSQRILSASYFINQLKYPDFLLIGDSNTEGWYVGSTKAKWAERLRASNPSLKIEMEARQGASTQTMINVIPEMLLHQPKAAIMAMGTNDAAEVTNRIVFMSRYSRIVDSLTKYGTRVIVNAILPTGATVARNDSINVYNTHLQAAYGTYPYTYIDLNTPFKSGSAINTYYFADAGTHLNAQGALIYNSIVTSVLSNQYNLTDMSSIAIPGQSFFQGQMNLNTGNATNYIVNFGVPTTPGNVGVMWTRGNNLLRQTLTTNGSMMFDVSTTGGSFSQNKALVIGGASNLPYVGIGLASGVQPAQQLDVNGTVKANTAIFTAIPEYTDNADAIGNGLTAGMLYRTGDNIKIVH